MLIKKLRDLGCADYSVVSADPPVFYLYYGRNLSPLFKLLGDSRSYFLFAFPQSKEREPDIEKMKKYESDHKRTYPRHKFIFLCNSKKEFDLLGSHKLDAVHVNHNCFTDERIFHIEPDIPKVFDAVYDAQIGRIKRHYLASEIESLALITYLYYPGLREPYVFEIMKMLERAHWFNRPYRNYRRLTPEEVCACLNQCRVGLCLSASEGAMYASIQYLLSGLPVVSTRSVGGRDEFFDDEYVKIVDDDPSSVRAGVEELIKRNIPASIIRGRTIEKILAHRERFISLVESIYRDHGIERDFREEWGRIFFDKMLKFDKLNNARKILNTL